MRFAGQFHFGVRYPSPVLPRARTRAHTICVCSFRGFQISVGTVLLSLWALAAHIARKPWLIRLPWVLCG